MKNVNGQKTGTTINVDDPVIVQKLFSLCQEKSATRNAVGMAIVRLGIAALEAKRGGPIPTEGVKRSSLAHTVEL